KQRPVAELLDPQRPAAGVTDAAHLPTLGGDGEDLAVLGAGDDPPGEGTAGEDDDVLGAVPRHGNHLKVGDSRWRLHDGTLPPQPPRRTHPQAGLPRAHPRPTDTEHCHTEHKWRLPAPHAEGRAAEQAVDQPLSRFRRTYCMMPPLR